MSFDPSLESPGKSYFRELIDNWNRFWFSPRDVRLTGIIRILVGSMVLYTHLVWTIGIDSFLLDTGLIPSEFVRMEADNSGFFWSHLFSIESATTLYIFHAIALVIFAMFAAGLFTRVTSILSFFLIVGYANRLAPAQFGLDQVNAFLTMYLAIAPAGAACSVDAWIRKRRNREQITESVSANISLRLMQIHMCVVYLFAGLAKFRGDSWVLGDAIWGAFASYEYQTFDMTWTANYTWLIHLLTIGTLVFEIGYCALVWNRMTRPILIATAIAMHIGIGLCMGMITFGLIMIFGNLAFLSDSTVDRVSQFFQRFRKSQSNA